MEIQSLIILVLGAPFVPLVVLWLLSYGIDKVFALPEALAISGAKHDHEELTLTAPGDSL